MPKLDQLFETIRAEQERVIAVIVHLNDTYLIEERAAEGFPGFPRLVSTVRRIRSTVTEILGRDGTLVVHSGDFLGPSRVGKRTKGAIMVRLMNAVGVDWCVLGNHELDYGQSELIARLDEARFGVTIANARASGVTVVPAVLWPSPEEPRVAITGVISDEVAGPFLKDHWTVRPARAALEEFVASHSTVPFRIVLTHANREEDRNLRRCLPLRTILLGGHDHDIHWIERDGFNAPVMKNLANLKTVRVVVLLGGGSQVEYALQVRYAEVYRQRCAAAGVVPDLRPPVAKEEDPVAPSFPGDCEEVLQAVPAFDAALIRSIWGTVDPVTLDSAEPLLQAIARLPHRLDEMSVVLERDDHELPDKMADAIVEKTIHAGGGDDDEIVRDVETDPREGFDTSEKSIRSVETPFGDLAAECVRCHSATDIAILNAGSFRADAVLPARLLLGHVRDVFLYDNERAVVVIELPYTSVEALLAHGRARSGTGGYVQYYPRTWEARGTVRVAITRFVLEDPFDGYQSALAASLGTRAEDIPALVQEKAVMTFGIIDTIRAHAPRVELPTVRPSSAGDVPPEEAFIVLARTFWKIRRETADGIELHDVFHFAAEGRLPEPLKEARDRLRAWVSALPEVDAAEVARQGRKLPVLQIAALAQSAHARLGELIDTLEQHKATYADGLTYETLLNYAAYRFAGWNALHEGSC